MRVSESQALAVKRIDPVVLAPTGKKKLLPASPPTDTLHQYPYCDHIDG